MSHLGVFFKQRRTGKGLNLAQLARRIGYQNITKGSNRIQRFESGGKIHPELLGKLADALEVGPDEIRREAYKDYQEWLAWADEPMRPYVVVRLLACVYQRTQLPDDALTEAAMERFAADMAREKGRKTWLVLSRRVSVYFDAEGRRGGRIEATPEMPCEPFATIGGKKVQFDFGGGTGLRSVERPGR